MTLRDEMLRMGHSIDEAVRAEFALAAREALDGMLAACELTGTPVEVVEWITTTTHWSRDDVRHRILAGEGARWAERYRAAHSQPTEQATPDLHEGERK